jgi:exodeoxyribonuclease V gamma subunit
MLRLVYSNRTEELLAELATRVRAQQAREGALVPVQVVVPSASVEAYLRLGIAREQGVAANLAFARLGGFAAGVVEAASSARPKLADAADLEALALRLLIDDEALASDAELAPVGAYLRGGGDSRDAMDVRRVQLAARIGRLFEEYTASRGEMLAANVHRVAREGGLAASPRAGARPLVTLNEAVAGAELAAPRPVHVFGFEHVPRGFLELFERVARTTDVTFYALSPCEGFWEDPDPGDPAPLHLWGRPGREQVRALNALARFDHDDRFVDPAEQPGPRTLLHQIQSDVLRREPARSAVDPRLRFDRDESVVVLEHASVRRELEAVASEIWRLAERDPSLRFDEIAILVPDAAAAGYAAQAPAVFREAHDLPLRVTAGTGTAKAGSVAEAADLLLALPLGRFTRQELLRLILHPAILGAIDAVDPVRWASWCDALGVAHGADRNDHAETYIERDVYNWDQALRRLALGAFMAGDASGDPRPFESAGEAYVPYEVAGAEMNDAASFGLLLRSLLADARFARSSELTMREWAGLLCKLVETYVAPAGASEEEELARCLRKLHGLAAFDLGDARVGYRIACELARRHLGRIGSGATGEGVVLGTLAALRPVPFRVVFTCGLGEGVFPSPDAEEPLDLRRARRRDGDLTVRERDKYGFLELLVGTRDRLYLSYVSREPLTGQTLAPSSVVEELLHAIGRGYVSDLSTLRRRHPLRRWAPPYFPELFGGHPSTLGTMRLAEAHAEARTMALRSSADLAGARLGADDVFARIGSDPVWAGLADHLGLVRLLEEPAPRDGRVSVPMNAILKFLEFPLQGWARFRVGLDEVDDEDPSAREDEPFETDARREVLFLREVLLDAVARGCPVELAYDEAVRARELRGAGPSGLFARGERGPHLETLAAWREELAARGAPAEGLEVVRFGRAGEHARAGKVFDAVNLDMDIVDSAGVTRMVRVEIGGRTLPRVDEAGVTLVKRPKQKWDDPWVASERDRASLRAFVDHAMLAASGVAPGVRHASIVVVKMPEEPAKSERVTFGPMSRDEACVWLRGVVRELLTAPHAYFLPCEAVFAHARRGSEASLGRAVEEARAKLGDADGALALRSAYGPVPRPQTYPAPDEARALEMAAARFGAFFSKLEREP